MTLGNSISKMFKNLFTKSKTKAVQKIDMRVANKPEKKNDSKKKRKIGNTRISGFIEHRFSNFHMGTFTPLRRFRVNHKTL